MENSPVEDPDTDQSQDSRVVADYATTNWGETQVALEETLQAYFKVLAVLVPPLFLAVGIGYHLDNSEQPPLSLLLPVSGGLSGFLVAVCLCIWDKVPEKESVARVLSCGILGSLIGLCFLGIDWTFEPAGSYTLLSAGLGFCASLPAIVSFGLAGGPSRPLNWAETKTLLIGLAFSLGCGLLSAFEDANLFLLPGFSGGVALVVLITGGRIDLPRLWGHIESTLIETRRGR